MRRRLERAFAGHLSRSVNQSMMDALSESEFAPPPNAPRPAGATDAATVTAALLTARGRGAVATIRLTGSDPALASLLVSRFAPASGRPLHDFPPGRIVFGRIGGEPAEEVVVCRPEPGTVDLHCHGGEAAAARLLGDFAAGGCRVVSWFEQSVLETSRLHAECLEALSRATTLRTASILLEQHHGVLHESFERITAQVARLPDATDTAAHALRTEIAARIDALLAWKSLGLHLTLPWRVVVGGLPNAGKSSLINALCGYARSIVHDTPGTTRDIVTEQTAFDGWPVELADTAGLRDAPEAIESEGVARARARLASADCRVIVIDRSVPADERALDLVRQWPDAIVVAHKADLPDRWAALMPAAALPVSSVTGEGIDPLIRHIVQHLVPRVPPPGTPLPVCERQVEVLERLRSAVEGANPLAGEIARELLR